MVCCGWVAWASIAVGAWDRICDLARLVVSAEKYGSSIRERDSVRFVARSVRLLTVASRRFWTAPSVARAVVTVSSAASTAVIAASASPADPLSNAPIASDTPARSDTAEDGRAGKWWGRLGGCRGGHHTNKKKNQH